KTADTILQAAVDDKSLDIKGLKAVSTIALAGVKSEQKYGEILARFLADGENRAGLFPDYRDIFLTQNGTPRKTILKKATLEGHPRLEDIIEAEKARLFDLQQMLNLQEVAADNQALVYLSGEILNTFQKGKEAYGYLDYDDLILKTSELLAREGIAPWILYKLDGGIDHILVDEAQDTNQIQWQLVEKLSDEFFSGYGGREGVLRTVFAVGDIKQSIFRFQGAEPEEFEAAKERIRRKAVEANLALEDCALHLSFRSTEAVLKVVDTTFASAERQSGIAAMGETISHQAERLGQHGLVEVWPPEQKIEPDQPPPGWVLPREQKFSTTPEARLAGKIARHLEEITAGTEMLQSRDREVRYGDILVLVQTRTAFLDHLIRELKVRKIPVAGSDRMVLADQLVVQDLLALVQFVLLPTDDYSLAAVLKGPLINLDDNDLMALAIGRKGSLWQALKSGAKKNPALKAALGFLKPLLALADFITPYNFFAEVLGPCRGRKLFIRRLGSEIQDPLDEFLSTALEFEKTHSPSLQGFLKWFGADKSQIKRDMERGKDEVRIMTIHGAKGLQAPIVYLPDTFKPATKKRESLLEIPPRFETPNDPEALLVWVRNKDLEVGPLAAAAETLQQEKESEHNRLLYVAMTRAEDRLYISGWTGKAMPKGATWYSSIRDAVAAIEGLKTIPGDHELPVLRLENSQTRDPVPDRQDISKRAEPIAIPDWAHRPVKPEGGITGVLHPSRVIEEPQELGATAQKGQARAIQKGNLIHKLLEVLPGLARKSREAPARAYLATPAFSLSKPEQQRLWASVSRVLDNPAFAGIFGPGSRSEVSLVGVIDGKFISAQIDRLIVKADEVLIIDYKSNRDVPENPEDVPPGYLAQLGLYAKLVKEVYGGRKVRTALLWT
ncbi:MAG: double-strand break repair helicase AddA, partial [Sphingomonadales bacterium]